MEIDWTEKYRPNTLDEIIGSESAKKELEEWGKNWRDKRAVILYGKPGIGKTSASYALASDQNWDVIELNASDKRTRDKINRIAGSASVHGDGTKLIILDEADNIHGDADRGGAKEVVRVIKNTNQPIILIANEYYAIKKEIRKLCKPIQFKSLRGGSVSLVLRRICSREGIKIDDDAVDRIVETSNGDLRAAINDLQAIVIGREMISKEDVVIYNRDAKESIFDVLTKVFVGMDMNDALYSAYDLDETPEGFIHWVDENLPMVYSGTDISGGFEYLSNADIFLGRTRGRQEYGLWRYAIFLMVCGVLTSKSRTYKRIKYQPPSRFKLLVRSRPARERMDSLSAKLGRKCNVSQIYARTEMIPLFKTFLSIDEIEMILDRSSEEKEDEKEDLSSMNKGKKRQRTLFDF